MCTALCCVSVCVTTRERGRDHHHDDPTLQRYLAVRCSVLQRGAACCSVLPTAPAPRAVCRRCPHTPSCLSLSTPARIYLGDSGMPPVGCSVETAGAVVVDKHEQWCAASLEQHLPPCNPARVMCVCVCARQGEFVRVLLYVSFLYVRVCV